jgi:hypothetical protein
MILLLLVLTLLGLLLLLQATGSRHARTSVLTDAPTKAVSDHSGRIQEAATQCCSLGWLEISLQTQHENSRVASQCTHFPAASLIGHKLASLRVMFPGPTIKTDNQLLSTVVSHSADFERHL